MPKHPIDGTTHGPRSAEATHHSMGLLAAVYSQYKPVERTLVGLNTLAGRLLDSVETELCGAASRTFKAHHPSVNLVTQTDHTGLKLTPQAMRQLAVKRHRSPGLEKWLVEIAPMPV
ncbi:MAG: hypothetical protein AAGD09_24710 [Cyanobacteria bacterium P01_F01_bin.56]